MSEINDAFADVKVEGSDPFAEVEKAIESNKETTPAESQPAKEEEGAKPVQGEEEKPTESTEPKEDDPFHKRWAVREEKLKAELEEKLQSELEAKTRELEEKFSKPDRGESVSIPKWFSRIHGEDPEAWKEYKEYDQELRDEIKQEFLAAQEAQRQQADEEVKHWNKWVDTEIETLQSKGYKFDRNELIKIILDYRPTDDNNNFDFEKGYKIYEAIKLRESDPAKSKARKQVADISTRSSSGGDKPKDFVSSTDIRRKGWHDL